MIACFARHVSALNRYAVAPAHPHTPSLLATAGKEAPPPPTPGAFLEQWQGEEEEAAQAAGQPLDISAMFAAFTAVMQGQNLAAALNKAKQEGGQQEGQQQ